MSKKPRDNRPYIPPVKRIELSQDHVRGRLVTIAVLLAIAAVAIGYGFYTALNVQPGWNMVTVSSSKPNCGQDFNLMYDFSETGGNAATVNKRLRDAYTEGCERGFLLFSPDVDGEGMGNVYAVNRNINSIVQVEPELYAAFAQLERSGDRSLFLAPVYREYERAMRMDTDAEAAIYDPNRNPDVMDYVDTLMDFIRSPEHISLELLDENTVRLSVSEAYQAFAVEYGIETYLDFGWMKNAVLADYLADTLADLGFTHGYLASYDGFTRNLDSRGGEFRFNLFDRVGNDVYAPGELVYSGPMAIVFLRNWPMVSLDQWHYYAYTDGGITSVMVSDQTGTAQFSLPGLVGYGDTTCADLLLQLKQVWMRETFDSQSLSALREDGIHAIWCQEGTVWYYDSDAVVNLLPTGEGMTYQTAFAG